MSTLIVGVLNVTPDSFSDGGRFATAAAAVEAGVRMADEGADWIDVGGESTRPGATPVPADEEIARVVPVLSGLRERLAGRARLSVDTYKEAAARAALAAGATVVNDVSGGRLDPGILRAAADAGAVFVAGHMRGTPADMMEHAGYGDVLAEVTAELRAAVDAARAAGVREVWADPGIGFSKTTEANLVLLRGLRELRAAVRVPLMVGVSRKRFIGELTGRAPGERAFGTAAAVAAAVLGGVDAVRVHDVAAMRDVVRVAAALAPVPVRA